MSGNMEKFTATDRLFRNRWTGDVRKIIERCELSDSWRRLVLNESGKVDFVECPRTIVRVLVEEPISGETWYDYNGEDWQEARRSTCHAR